MPPIRLLAAVVGGLGMLAVPMSAQKSPAVPDLLKLGADYVAAYVPRLSGVALEELYLLVELTPRMQTPKRVASDMVFVNLNGTAIALRDVFAIDTKPVRERTLRINEALARPTTASWAQAQEYARQGHFHFLSEIVLRVSEPTLALQCIAAANQSRFTYRVESRKKMNGAQVAALRFQEPQRRDVVYLLGTRGNAWASGRIWLDETTGTVHQTELWLESATEVARTTVMYSAHPALELWLPKETVETYESREIGAGPTSMGKGAFNLVHRLEAKATYSNPRYSPIDLTKMR